MKKMVIVLAIFLLAVASAQAINVGVLIDYSDGTFDKECVSVNSGDSAYDAIVKVDNQRGDISMTIDGFTGIGHFIRAINGYVPKTSSDNGNTIATGWNFWVEDGNQYAQPELSPGIGMAIDDYEIQKSQLIILKYGDTVFESSPPYDIITLAPRPEYKNIGAACLRITDLDLQVDGESQKNMEDGDKIKEDVKPGSVFELSFEVENMIDEADDIQMEDAIIFIEIDRIDDGDSLDEESDEFDVNADDTEEVDIEFTLPIESDDRSYEMIIRVEADGEDGVMYYDEWVIPFSYDKDNHELLIKRAFVTPSTVSCGDSAEMELSIYNIGDKREKEVRVEVESQDLDFKFVENDIELDDDLTDKDSRYTKRLYINIPDDIAYGEYDIHVRAYYDDTKLSDQTSIALTIDECKSTVDEDSDSDHGYYEDDEDVVLKITDDSSFKGVTGGSVSDIDDDDDFLGDNQYLIVVLVVIIVVVIIGVLVVVSVRR